MLILYVYVYMGVVLEINACHNTRIPVKQYHILTPTVTSTCNIYHTSPAWHSVQRMLISTPKKEERQIECTNESLLSNSVCLIS